MSITEYNIKYVVTRIYDWMLHIKSNGTFQWDFNVYETNCFGYVTKTGKSGVIKSY